VCVGCVHVYVYCRWVCSLCVSGLLQPCMIDMRTCTQASCAPAHKLHQHTHTSFINTCTTASSTLCAVCVYLFRASGCVHVYHTWLCTSEMGVSSNWVCLAYKLPQPTLLNPVQSGKDPQDTSSCRSFFAKEPLIVGLFCGNDP